MITSPSGGQVLIDRGATSTSPASPGAVGKIRKGRCLGRWWQELADGAAGDTGPRQKCLTRFNIDWTWDGGDAILMSRATGLDRPRAALDHRAAQGARHQVDLSQQLDSKLACLGQRGG